jgi:hypothetical protein
MGDLTPAITPATRECIGLMVTTTVGTAAPALNMAQRNSNNKRYTRHNIVLTSRGNKRMCQEIPQKNVTNILIKF